MSKKDVLYDYYFHFNIFTEKWCAVKRTQSNEYLNGTLPEEDVLKHNTVHDLIKYLAKNG